jgi:hypothetical protein
MNVTARGLNRATLGRQLLLRREKLGVVDAVHRIVALQAQEPATPYIALWNRLTRFDPSDLDHAFTDTAVVKGQLMRITLHAVDVADYPAFHLAMQRSLRAARLHDRRFIRTGLKIADAEALIPEVITFTAEPRTNAEAEAWLDERPGATEKARCVVGVPPVRTHLAPPDRRAVVVRLATVVRRGAREPGDGSGRVDAAARSTVP